MKQTEERVKERAPETHTDADTNKNPIKMF